MHSQLTYHGRTLAWDRARDAFARLRRQLPPPRRWAGTVTPRLHAYREKYFPRLETSRNCVCGVVAPKSGHEKGFIQ